jgi:rhomboid domain-containing protein 1
MRRGGGSRDRSGLVFVLIMLFDQLNRMGLFRNGNGNNRLPIITLATMAVCIVLHFFLPEIQHLLPFSPSIGDVCIHVPSIWYNHDWKRLFTAAVFHADDTHLYYNMLSLLWKGSQLELSMGSPRFAATLASLTALSHSLVVVGSMIAFRYFDYSNGLRSCAGLLFHVMHTLHSPSMMSCH